MSSPDFFGISDRIRQLTAPAGFEAVHEDGFSWARQGTTYQDTTKIGPTEWNMLIGNLRGIGLMPDAVSNEFDPSGPYVLRDALVNFVTVRIDTYIAAYVNAINASLATKAPIESPTFTGVPRAPTPAGNTDTTQIANTAWVQARIAEIMGGAVTSGLSTIADLAAAIQMLIDTGLFAETRKEQVVFASTANVTLTGPQTVDGVTSGNGQRGLIKDQTDPAQNGIWITNTEGPWTRAADANAGSELVSCIVWVKLGTQNADTSWFCGTPAPITLGTTPITFYQTGSPSDGADGRTLLNGAAAPGAGLGADGDFYIETTNWRLYGPKTAGAWGGYVALRGEDGIDGTNGTDGVDMLAQRYRPGDAPILHAEVLTEGDPQAVAHLGAGDTMADDDGAVVRLTGPGIVASRTLMALEPARLYQSRFVVRRRVNTGDPASEIVRLAVAWYDQNKIRLAGGSAQTIVQDIADLTVASGRRQVIETFSRSAGVGADNVAPATARYYRAYVETFGDPMVATDVEIIDTLDTTDLTAWSPDVSVFDGRLVAMEGLDAGSRLAALESATGTPSKLTFPTQADAVAETIPGYVDEIELLNYAAVGDGQGYRLKRAAGVPAAGFQSFDGAWWEPAGNPKSRILATLTDAEESFFPADTTEVRIIGRGGARFRAVDTTTYNAVPALLRFTDAGGRKWIINEWKLKPVYAGGDDTGTTDATAAINAIFDFLRTDIAGATTPYGYTGFEVELIGGIFRGNGSINASGLGAWNVVINGGAIHSYATGKNAFDLCGSRGYTMRDTIIVGFEASMPATGIYSARNNTGAQACDNNLFDNVTVIGHFSVAADYCYAQETTKRVHCRYYQMNYQGRVAIYNGYAAAPPSSDFQTVVTGSQSFGNNTYDNCDWRFLPSSNIAYVTQIDKGATTVVHVASHPFVNGNSVVLHQLSSLTALNGMAATVSNATATSFELNIDSSAVSGSGTGITGRVIRAMTQAPILFGRGNQHRFTTCYLVSYASSAIEIDFSDGFIQENNLFDFMIEGACPGSHFRFNLGGAARKMRDVKFVGGGTQARLGLFSFDGGTGTLTMEGANIAITSHQIMSTLPLCTAPAQLAIIGDILYPNRAGIAAASLLSFKGRQTAIDDGKTLYGKWHTTWAPTISGGTGSTGAATATAKIEQLSDTHAKVDISITVSAVGDWGATLNGTWPAGLTAAATYIQYMNGRSNATGLQLNGQVIGGASNFLVRAYDNTFPGSGTMSLSGVVEFASLA